MLNSAGGLHFVLWIGLSCVFHLPTLGCPYNHWNCRCEGSAVQCFDLTELPPVTTIYVLPPVVNMTLWGGLTTTIQRTSLPADLVTLSLHSLPLTNITNDAFERSATTLQTLYIEGASFHALPVALSQLTSLVSLTLIGTNIQTWDSTTLQQLSTSLTSIRLQDIGLLAWPGWLSHFSLLRKIDLSNNFLQNIPPNAFVLMTSTLFELTLRNNSLSHAPEDIFSLTNLKKLDLSYNQLSNVTETVRRIGSAFSWVLYHLELSYVGMSYVPDFSDLSYLKFLSISGNMVSNIPSDMLPASLTDLYIGDCGLSSVPSIARLSTLYMPRNQISIIEPNSFSSSLISLFLSNNRIARISYTAFRNLSLLKYLDLQGNPISYISPLSFSDLTSLEVLILRSTRLYEVPVALASLSRQAQISLSSANPWGCFCPPDNNLVVWYAFKNYPYAIVGNCLNGEPIRSYLIGHCR